MSGTCAFSIPNELQIVIPRNMSGFPFAQGDRARTTDRQSSTRATNTPSSTNWHHEQAANDQGREVLAPLRYYGPQDSQLSRNHMTSPPNTLHAGPRYRSGSFLMPENGIPLSFPAPGPARPTDLQLNMAYAYGIQRPDGSYTRLVRADELNDVNRSIPPSQGPEGLIILPEPRQPSPSQRHGSVPVIPAHVASSVPCNRSFHFLRSSQGLYDETQSNIDVLVSQSAAVASIARPPTSRPSRREKIYCDKWIHEGICAFTQMGCKYKHEMPMDKATQMSLGLNHGIPNWYRRAFGINMNSPPAVPAALPSTITQGRFLGNWRRSDSGPSSNGGSPTNGTSSGFTGGRDESVRVAAPHNHQQSSFNHNKESNFYNSVKTERQTNGSDNTKDVGVGGDSTAAFRSRPHFKTDGSKPAEHYE